MLRQSALLLLAACLLAGCAGKTPSPSTKVSAYPKCHAPIQYVHERGNGTAKGIAGGAVRGGAIGAIGGAIVGAIVGGRPAGVLASAAVGAAFGGLSGAAQNNQQAEDNKHLAQYLEQIDGDIDGLDVVHAAGKVSLQCYNQEFAKLIAEIKSGKVARSAAESRYQEISSGRREALEILGEQPDGELQRQYEDALATP